MTKLNIVYASEMGAAMDVADKTEAIAKDKGIDVVQFGMDSVSIDDLKIMNKLLIITSTTGDGDLPMMGEDFWSELSVSDLDLSSIEYSVCALGDSSHHDFCGAGKKVDGRLQELGAKKVLDMQECDGDTEGSEEWAELAMEKLGVILN
jgi:sulfite reductase alpha subunit-like flavoprotein|tara:strand:+ start:1127 stop:1573 length:447 start_codon:yes stop_codon:yes gene_type:complete